MLKKILLSFIVIIALFTLSGNSFAQSDTTNLKTGPRWLGYTFLGMEYVVAPIVASQFWWKHALAKNPFKNIYEQEPYLEDKMWHFWNGENITDFNYWVMKRYMGHDSPWKAMGMTLLTLTAVEVLDASDAKARWGFSVRDQLANMGGIGLWYLKHKYPKIPIDVRVGIRRWERIPTFVSQSWRYPANFDKPLAATTPHLDKYSVLKAEIIIRPYNFLYVGFASSLKNGSDGWGISKNLFGITAGFDAIRWYANKHKTKASPYLMTFGKYFSESPCYTHWYY
jgi:hypothetical protein